MNLLGAKNIQTFLLGGEETLQMPIPSQQYFGPNSTFWEHGSDLPLPQFKPHDILIAVMGMTGAGKTSFISKIAGVDMKIGHSLLSCTKNVGIATTQLSNRHVHFIDTPGFDDTDLKDGDILEIIALYLTNTHSHRIRLSGILYLHSITECRVGGTTRKNIKLFRGLVGDKSMDNVALVTTMWGNVDHEVGEARMEELAKTDQFWGRMIESGATVDKYDGTRKDGLRIVNMLLRKSPCILQIQAEIERGIKIEETTAGKEVNDRIAELKAQYESEMDDLKLQLQKAINARDFALHEKKLKEQEEAMQRLQEAHEAQERLLQATIKTQQAQIEALQDKGGCIIL